MAEPDRARTYDAGSATDTAKAFLADAEEAARFGWSPISQSWAGSALTVTYRKAEAVEEAQAAPPAPAPPAVLDPDPLPADIARAYSSPPAPIFRPAAGPPPPVERERWVPGRLAHGGPLPQEPVDKKRSATHPVVILAAMVVVIIGGIWLWNNVVKRELDIWNCQRQGYSAYELRLAPGSILCDEDGSIGRLKDWADDN